MLNKNCQNVELPPALKQLYFNGR